DEGHRLVIENREPGIFALRVTPRLGIGQTGYLVCTEAGNLLSDVPACIDAEGSARGGPPGVVTAHAARHPHAWGAQLEGSAAFDGAAVFVCRADADWVQRTSPGITTYFHEAAPLPDVQLRRTGGHFAGSAVAVWPGEDGAGVMLSGDS